MTPMQYIKRLVLLAFIIKVTSHPTPYGSRLINFLDSGIGGRRFSSGNYDDDHHDNQKNVETGTDSSLVEISFQPLRELESVSASQPSSSTLYSLRGKQFLDEDSTQPLALVPNLSAALTQNQRNFHRRRRTHQRILENDYSHRRQQYPDESSNERPTSSFSSSPAVNGLNEISHPEEDETESGRMVPLDFMRRDLQNKPASGELSEMEKSELKSHENYPWNIFKRQQHPLSFGPMDGQQLFSYLDDDANNKRNALAAFKRQKFKSHQTQFIPSISVGAMTHLGDFFKNLKNNLEFMEKGRLSNTEEQLLEGDHPISVLREELTADGGAKPTGTAAFLHAIRTYRPSQRIRSLVALNPEGYHGSQFLDPNYMWVGLGKRK